ncbi:TIGR01777 family oxidoreductase [Marinobacter salicampi]|uniref:TIGR01777 family oxidoreductase n=1 Tax=Marinobacter salicampi TaxID=435907 RepID=UPI001408AA36|nr:TIGR01777 family oxidoreductase [Marinobacter salicampi]
MTDQSLLLTGGTGFIGTVLCRKLLQKGYDVTVLSRQSPADVKAACGRVTPVATLDELKNADGFTGVINLAGEGIAEKRWSEKRKQELRDSRIGLTEQLVAIVQTFQVAPEVAISGSAVGFYGDQGEKPVDEKTEPEDEFTHRLCRDWEAAAKPLESGSTRVCYSRTGLVIGRDGGFLKRMAPPFKLGLGGRLGDGQQYMPWVHREDITDALIWLLENVKAQGPYNLVSPNPVRNRTFTKALGKQLSRPTPFPVPPFVLKIALGEMSRLLLTGQQAYPERLLADGFQFRYARLEDALAEALG